MKRNVVFAAEAQADLLAAYQWYEAQSPSVARSFLDAVAVAMERIALSPLAFAATDPPFRRAIVRRFPWSVYFVAERAEPTVVVVGVLHGARDLRSALLGRRGQ